MNKIVKFTFDNNIDIIIDDTLSHSGTFSNRFDCERHFRLIHSYLLLNNIIKNNIIDLGSWIGDNSIPWAKMTSSTIYAIDPSEINCDFINSMCKLNNISNIQVINKAISNKNEILSTNNDLTHCSFVWDDNFVGHPKNYEGIHKLEATSLDELYKNNIIDNIGYIHLDVEGMEYKILQGSCKIIDVFTPIISFEGHLNAESIEIKKNIDFLKERGYSIYMINDVIKDGQCWGDCRNFLAFPSNLESVKIVESINRNFSLNLLQPL